MLACVIFKGDLVTRVLIYFSRVLKQRNIYNLSVEHSGASDGRNARTWVASGVSPEVPVTWPIDRGPINVHMTS